MKLWKQARLAALTGGTALVLSPMAHAAIDVSDVVDEITGSIAAVTAIGIAVLGVLVVVATFKYVRRAF